MAIGNKLVIYFWIASLGLVFIGFILDKSKMSVIIFLLVLAVTNLIYQYDVSKKIFLGDELASSYGAEAPGYTIVNLYQSNWVRIDYVGILGVTDYFYMHYETNLDTVLLLTKQPIELINHEILIDDKSYHIKIKKVYN